MVPCGTHNFSGLDSVVQRVNPAPVMAVRTIQDRMVLRGLFPMRMPTLLKTDPMDDSILFPTDSTQDVIFENFARMVLFQKVINSEG